MAFRTMEVIAPHGAVFAPGQKLCLSKEQAGKTGRKAQLRALGDGVYEVTGRIAFKCGETLGVDPDLVSKAVLQIVVTPEEAEARREASKPPAANKPAGKKSGAGKAKGKKSKPAALKADDEPKPDDDVRDEAETGVASGDDQSEGTGSDDGSPLDPTAG